uniref:Uncharacterized protein LOC8287159 n=1 Tax=Rhizophora mucronata TaxID=61149 RepID=A0A2P2MAJ2_RHIMU
MEDTDVEEGEACCFHNSNDDGGFNARVDPDIALSYIVSFFGFLFFEF